MANSYTQLYIQIVFAVKGRQNLISPQHKEELQKYITGIILERKSKLLAISCMPDHTHIFIGYKPTIPLPDLVRDIKAVSSKFINEHEWVIGKFNWQEGYGAFSYAQSQLTNVIQYINNQEKHHLKRNFKQEYIELLKRFEVFFEEQYIFESPG